MPPTKQGHPCAVAITECKGLSLASITLEDSFCMRKLTLGFSFSFAQESDHWRASFVRPLATHRNSGKALMGRPPARTAVAVGNSCIVSPSPALIRACQVSLSPHSRRAKRSEFTATETRLLYIREFSLSVNVLMFPEYRVTRAVEGTTYAGCSILWRFLQPQLVTSEQKKANRWTCPSLVYGETITKPMKERYLRVLTRSE